ncbi:hypothetical protein BHM03_00042819 [Ensete ventricosum]|nr:hypothetical protein BHM03_00042819 [Ensete ventricosum]
MLIITCLPSLFLVISGSSRQFVGFSREMDESIVKRIWDRAGEFFPALKSLGNKIDKIRVGHRPYTFCVETVTAAVDGEEMPRGEAAVVREQLRGSAAPHCFDDHHHHVSQPHGGDPHRQARLLRRASHDHPQTEEEGDDDDDDTTPIHVGLETAGCGWRSRSLDVMLRMESESTTMQTATGFMVWHRMLKLQGSIDVM